MMYPKTAAQSRSKFFRVKPGRCGALKLMRTVRAPSRFTTQLGSNLPSDEISHLYPRRGGG